MNYKAGIVSLGCAKNQVDAEMLLYNLKERGFTIVNDPADAVVTDYNAGIDFSFTYYGASTLMISIYEADGMLYCSLYEMGNGYSYAGGE